MKLNFITQTINGRYLVLDNNTIKLYYYDELLLERLLSSFSESFDKLILTDSIYYEPKDEIVDFVNNDDIYYELRNFFERSNKFLSMGEYKYFNGWNYIDEKNDRTYSIKNKFISVSGKDIYPKGQYYLLDNDVRPEEIIQDHIYKIDLVFDEQYLRRIEVEFENYSGENIYDIYNFIMANKSILNSLINHFNVNKKADNRDKIIDGVLKK